MRQGAAAANASGVNLAFLGANACYRQIRLQPTSVGPNRLQVCYKDAAEDPMAREQPALTTVNWNQAPVNEPRVDPHRLHVPVGRGQGGHGGHRRVVVVLRRLQPHRRPHVQHRHPRRVRPLRALPARPAQRRRAGALARSRASPTGPTSPTTPRRGTGAACWPAARPASSSLLGTTGAIPPIVIVGAIPGVTDVIRRAMENVYGRFGLGPGHLVRQLERQLVGRLHRRRRQRGDAPPAPLRLTAAGRPGTAACARAGMTPLAGPAPVRSTPSDGEIRHSTAPGRGARSPGACWRPPASPGCS